MPNPTVHSEQPSAIRPATITDLFDEYAEFSLRVCAKAPETIREQRLCLNRSAACFSAGTAAEPYSAFTPKRLMSAVADYASLNGPESRRWRQ